MRLLVLLLGACLITGCSTSGSLPEKTVDSVLERMELTQGSEVNSVPNFRIDSWEDIDSRNLILTSGLRNHYLVTLVQPCHELRTAFGIALDSRTSTLQRLDNIVVRGDGRQPRRCGIDRIVRLEPLASE